MRKLMIDVEEELKRARKLYPSSEHMTLAHAEEAGEVVKAAMDIFSKMKKDAQIETKKNYYGRLRKEIVQSIVTAIRLAENGDIALGVEPCEDQP